MSLVTIIMYHYVRDYKKTKYPEIKGLDISDFEGQIQYLQKNYNIISINQLINAFDQNEKLPPKSALLTFDDGYIDHFQYVLPILKKHKLQGSFYPPARAIQENKVLDVNKIHFILACVNNKTELFNELLKLLDHYKEEYSLKTKEEYFNQYLKANRFDSKEIIFIKRMLQVGLDEKLRALITDQLFKRYVTQYEEEFSSNLYMNIEMLKTLKEEGMHIGSHGYNHYWLGSLNEKEQEFEIDESIKFLNNIGVDLNKWTICYPFGNYNSQTINILLRKGCKLGFTSKASIAEINLNNRFELPRLDTNDLPKQASGSHNAWYYKA